MASLNDMVNVPSVALYDAEDMAGGVVSLGTMTVFVTV